MFLEYFDEATVAMLKDIFKDLAGKDPEIIFSTDAATLVRNLASNFDGICICHSHYIRGLDLKFKGSAKVFLVRNDLEEQVRELGDERWRRT